LVRGARYAAILLCVLLAEPAAAQARAASQPGDTLELRAGALARAVRVRVVAVADGRADVVEADRYYAVFSGLPLDTVVLAWGVRISPEHVSQIRLRGPRANVPLEWLSTPPPRALRLPSLQFLLASAAWGGGMGAAAGLLCDCGAVGRGAARGAAAVTFTAAAVNLGRRP
jgi:hypothetical protein